MENILIIDFGSQVTQLIARRIREIGVYSEIVNYSVVSLDFIKSKNPKGIIFSGGPASVYEADSPSIDPAILNSGIPILAICYGQQLLCRLLGGKVEKASHQEFGKAFIEKVKESILLEGFGDAQSVLKPNHHTQVSSDHEAAERTNEVQREPLGINEDSANNVLGVVKHCKAKDLAKDESEVGFSQVWMSHGDVVTQIPQDFDIIAKTKDCPFAIIGNEEKRIYGVQFHPEVEHTISGRLIFENFAKKICECKGDWKMTNFVNIAIDKIRNQVGDKKVICALSGGVDSSVTASLLHKAIGDNLICIFINNGLLRKNEAENVQKMFGSQMKINLKYIDATKIFLDKLAGVTDPEQKRKIIGKAFIEIFDEESGKLQDAEFLAQGTLYPDIIESSHPNKGNSVTIKSHHNVGGLPENMKLKLVEPLKELFKDEVRKLGLELGMSHEMVYRHPFPGPGLAVRIIGEITQEKISILQEADDIYIKAIKKAGLYAKIWQAFAALLPVKTVGVMGDARTYEYSLVLRAVTSVDGMTADMFEFPQGFLAEVSSEIIAKVRGVNRVVYDYTSKPPGTIEWE